MALVTDVDADLAQREARKSESVGNLCSARFKSVNGLLLGVPLCIVSLRPAEAEIELAHRQRLNHARRGGDPGKIIAFQDHFRLALPSRRFAVSTPCGCQAKTPCFHVHGTGFFLALGRDQSGIHRLLQLCLHGIGIAALSHRAQGHREKILRHLDCAAGSELNDVVGRGDGQWLGSACSGNCDEGRCGERF